MNKMLLLYDLPSIPTAPRWREIRTEFAYRAVVMSNSAAHNQTPDSSVPYPFHRAWSTSPTNTKHGLRRTTLTVRRTSTKRQHTERGLLTGARLCVTFFISSIGMRGKKVAHALSSRVFLRGANTGFSPQRHRIATGGQARDSPAGRPAGRPVG